MKTFSFRNTFTVLVSLGAMLVLNGGCGKKEAPSETVVKSPSRPASVSAETNSFNEVAAHLDPGGSFYLYLSTEQWLENLSTKISDMRQFVLSLPNVNGPDRANVGKLLDVVVALVKSSGLEEVSGVGASGLLVEKGMYRNKFMLHHYPGKNQGLLWSLFGKAPHALAGLDYLPETTALASFCDLDVPLLWKTLQEQSQQAGIPEVAQALDQLPMLIESQTGIKFDQLLASLGGEIGFILTLDANNNITLPQPNGGKLEISEPGLALMVKVKDDTIFNRLDQLLQANPQVVKVDQTGLKMRTMPLPIPLPLAVRPSVARSGDYLFLATTDKLITDLLAMKNGKGKSLKRSEEFKRISKGITQQGNSFSFISPELSRTINHVIKTVAFNQSQGQADGGMEMLQRLMGEDRENFTFSVGSNTKEGWVAMGNSSRHPAVTFLGPTLIAPVAIAAGMALPALAQAKSRAQSVSCVNNLKQIALAARLYASDHGEVLPKNFEAMKNELNSPMVLVCPGDQGKTRPSNWTAFNLADASYEIVSPGARSDEPQKVFARCLIHNNVCLVDGSVQQNAGPPRQATRPRAR